MESLNTNGNERRKTMSIESAKAFLERVSDDEDFRKELEAQTSKEERIKFVKSQGFDFTKEEIDSIKNELSDEDLDKVAGAGSWGWCQRNTCYGESV
jgi:predicted ribosomally synthesized peptide with nif11-like leader